MNRLSVRLFVSYLAVVMASTGVAFVTARALAPTFFRVSLEQGRPESTPGSGFGQGGPDRTEPTSPPSMGDTGTEPGSEPEPEPTTVPRSSGTGGPASPSTGATPSTGAGPGSTGHHNETTPSTRHGDEGESGSGHDDALGAGTGILAAGTVATTIVEVEEGVNDAFLSAIDGALLAGLAVALVVALAVSWMVSGRIMRPISLVREATVRLAEGHYTERIPPPAEEELAALANDVNRLAATLEATEARRTRLISEVAHELRTPLTTIQGSMEGLMDGVLAPSDEVYASVAEEAARLQRVVSDLSLLSRLDESALPLNITRIDLGPIANAVADRLRPQYDDQGVRLVVSGLHGLEVDADGDRLAQVFTNLIGNALGHTRDGDTVSVTGHTSGATVEIVVTDDGEGIEPDEIERIFERFHRGRVNRRHGSGLGLTIARSIARAHGGEVTAASPGAGRGASFTVRLPRHVEVDETSPRRPTPRADQGPEAAR